MDSSPPDNPRRGIALIVISVFLVAVITLFVKELTQRYSVWQVTFFRCLLMLPVVFFNIRMTVPISTLRTQRLGGHVLRALSGTTSMLLSFYAFHALPLAEATVLFNSGPLFAVLFAFLFLGEAAGGWRWAALSIGLVGILVITRPGFVDANLVGMAAGIAGAASFGLSMTNLRSLGRTEAHTTTVFYSALLSTVLTAVALPFVWQTPSLKDIILFVGLGLVAALTQLGMTRAYQYASAAVLTPFNYLGILWAALFGFVLWDEVPEWPVGVGGALVIAAGLMIVYREARSPRNAAIRKSSTLDQASASR